MRTQMRLSTKLICAFAILIAIQIGGNITALMLMGSINANVTELATNWLPSIDAISSIDHNFQAFRRQELLHVMSTDEATMPRRRATSEKLCARATSWMWTRWRSSPINLSGSAAPLAPTPTTC